MTKKPAKKTTKRAAKKPASAKRETPAVPADHASVSEDIDARIESLGDWRGETLARVRALIRQSVPGVVEEIKWRKPSNSMSGVPVWSSGGIICTGETYKDKVKLTFANGAALPDPKNVFNSSLEGNQRRAVDLHEGDKLNATAFKALIRAAIAHNTAKKNTKRS